MVLVGGTSDTAHLTGHVPRRLQCFWGQLVLQRFLP